MKKNTIESDDELQKKSNRLIPVFFRGKCYRNGSRVNEKRTDAEWNLGFCLYEQGMEEVEARSISFSEVISVPGCFDALPEYSGKRGTGIFRRFVECSGMVKLSLEAIGLRARIYWDRKEIGSCEHPYSPESFVFSSGAPGKHELMILVDNRMSDAASSLFHPYYDFYGYGGIYREVTLTELPIDIRIVTVRR